MSRADHKQISSAELRKPNKVDPKTKALSESSEKKECFVAATAALLLLLINRETNQTKKQSRVREICPKMGPQRGITINS